MANLDLFIVNVALPSIGRAFPGTGLASLSWVLNAYVILFAALLVPAGRQADRTSRRTAFPLGVGTFAAGSAVCAAAANIWVLVAARGVQAVGDALLMPASFGLLLTAAPAARRVAAVRAWTAVAGIAAALGPVAGRGGSSFFGGEDLLTTKGSDLQCDDVRVRRSAGGCGDLCVRTSRGRLVSSYNCGEAQCGTRDVRSEEASGMSSLAPRRRLRRSRRVITTAAPATKISPSSAKPPSESLCSICRQPLPAE
jgi:hypothetical protein